MIPITIEVANSLAGDHGFAHLLKIDFTNGPACFTDAGYDIDFSGNTYHANGLLLGMDSPKFTTELRVGEITLTFGAADQSVLALLLNTSQINRYVHVHRAILNTSMQVIP